MNPPARYDRRHAMTPGAATSRAEASLGRLADLGEPLPALLGGAENDRLEVAALDILHAAEIEDAGPPEVLQGVAEEPQLVLAGRVGGRQHQGRLPLQKADDALAANS